MGFSRTNKVVKYLDVSHLNTRTVVLLVDMDINRTYNSATKIPYFMHLDVSPRLLQGEHHHKQESFNRD